MDQDYQPRRKLPGPGSEPWDDEGPQARYAPAWRAEGLRRTRRASNWTAAALIAGVAATSGYFVHAASTPAAATSLNQTGSVAGHGPKPSVSHPVVTSGGSGVTVGSSGPGAAGSGGVSTATWRDN